MGVYIGASTRIYDRERDEVIYGRVPAGSVVVSGTLPSSTGRCSLYCAVIVKRVDAQTRAKVAINDLLRSGLIGRSPMSHTLEFVAGIDCPAVRDAGRQGLSGTPCGTPRASRLPDRGDALRRSQQSLGTARDGTAGPLLRRAYRRSAGRRTGTVAERPLRAGHPEWSCCTVVARPT